MITQNLNFLKIDPKKVEVQYQPHSQAKKKDCFNNSFRALSEHPDTLYVLGYVFLHNVPIEHAWIKQNNTYYDVTLDPKKHHGYIKVAELSFQEVMKYVEEKHSAPSLYDMNRFLSREVS